MSPASRSDCADRAQTPGEAVGLQLLADRQVVAPGRILLRQPLDLLGDAEHGLDVVAVLVRDHVGDREVAALRAEARLELIEEAKVEVDLLVGRAVERARRRRCRSAAG